MPTDYLNPQQIDTDKLWESVVTRDRYADGRFVFGVKTTGIFCRPTCPARRPNPENVEYFPDSDSALEAGYRACKRCHPLGKHPDIALVEQVRQIIEEQIDEPPTLAMIGADVGMSPFHVQRVFKRVTGISPNEYARARRIERFKDTQWFRRDQQPLRRRVRLQQPALRRRAGPARHDARVVPSRW